MLQPEKTRVILDYIKDHFADYQVTEMPLTEESDYSLRIVKDNEAYVLHVEPGALDDVPADDLETLLANYRVADVMHDIGDFPVIITRSGCIFGSP